MTSTTSARVACHLGRSERALAAVLAGGRRTAAAIAKPTCTRLLGVWVGEMCVWVGGYIYSKPKQSHEYRYVYRFMYTHVHGAYMYIRGYINI